MFIKKPTEKVWVFILSLILDQVAFYPECYWDRIILKEGNELVDPGRAFQVFVIP